VQGYFRSPSLRIESFRFSDAVVWDDAILRSRLVVGGATAGPDQLVGYGDIVNRIDGLAGNDTLQGAGLDDRLLGGAGRFRDSGMVGTPSNDKPGCFWRADLLEAALPLVEIIREVRPQVVVTYDDFGGYGHPDHIQVHRVTHYALALAASETFRPDLSVPWNVSKVYWTAFPKSVMRAGIEAMKEHDASSEFASMDPDDIPFACDDALVTTAIDGADHLSKKMAALRAHGTQVSVDGGFFALADNVGAEAFGTEYYRLASGVRVAPEGQLETDLFAGISE
jgi:N-acetyl-1-D-myo-inositol-2-amino-2-deoxy-alpha-D-glucopyranoside deacetylase